MGNIQTQILRVLRSPKFFIAILVLFAVESIWIAISAAYPMVFDENTHFGVIQLHAAQWSPLFLHQPPNSEFAGALTRDPSYLYHYILSLPYRLIAQLTDSQMIQVIVLRFINIAFFGAGLILFRKLLLRTKVSPAIINVAFLFFVLTPVVPLLAGQINYDNLLMPVVAILLLLTTSISSELATKKLPLSKIAAFLTVGMLGCLVQFSFLPVFAGAFLWLAWMFVQGARKHQFTYKKDFQREWFRSSWQKKFVVLAPLIVSAGLFVQMYGVNIVRYHNLVVQCHQVLSVESCSQNGAWNRNYEARLNNDGTANTNPALYAASWTYRMFIAMFYTSSGGASPAAWYLSINPLPIIFVTALSVFFFGVLLVFRYHTALFRGYRYLGLLIFVSLFYCASLWLRNYQDYVHLGEKVAINGRYLFLIALPVMIIIALAYRQLLAEKHHLKIGLLLAIFVLFLQGGGALSYIASSKESWYWQNRTVVRLNLGAQKVIKPFIIFKEPIRSFGSTGG